MGERSDTDDRPPKVPLGIPDLDRRLAGGVRPGTSVLAIGPFGSGYRALLHSATVMHGNWQAEAGLFGLEYDDLVDRVRQPANVRYISVSDSAARLEQSIDDIAAHEYASAVREEVTVYSLADQVAELGPVRPSSTGTFEYTGADEGPDNPYQQLLRHFGDYLMDDVSDGLVFIDAISDFLPMAYKFLDWTDLYFISQTLCHLIARTNGVLVAGADADLLDTREVALLERTFDAVLEFGWFGEGYQRRRTMTVTKFPEYWAEAKSQERVTFDVEIDRGSFGITNVEKIPPSRL